MVSKYTRSHSTSANSSPRVKILLGSFYVGLLAILGRLFYWQIIEGSWLKVVAQDQYQTTLTHRGQRGQIFTNDQQLLVGNTTRYRLVGYPHLIDHSPADISHLIAPLLINELANYQQATQAAIKKQLEDELQLEIENQLSKDKAKWVSLFPSITTDAKNQLTALKLTGLDFEPFTARFYPEASMAAHLTGFVGQNRQGLPTGYFGVEGGLNQELMGQKTTTTLNTDALGFSLAGASSQVPNSTSGRDVVLTIERDLQFLAENMLQVGLEKYGAAAGEIIITQPQTGHILALAAEPKYDQQDYQLSEPSLYVNPSLNNLFEPGSIMKTLTVAMGLDTQAITPETTCSNCKGPRTIGQYTIRTWNDEYHPNISVREALAKSDNIAMIHVAEQIGTENFKKYLQKFGFGQELKIDLDGDLPTPFPQKWGPVELATRSFGQGISVTSLQMMRAVGAIANGGQMMQPQIVAQVNDSSGQKIKVQPKVIRQVISRDTADQVTEMMVYAAQSGEAQWTYSKTHSVAGKTGTSQVPAQEGGYEADATIASFIGFAPPDNPQFLMLVKLIKPQSSPWAAETAAPLWYQMAEKLFLNLNIPPDRQAEKMSYN